MQTIGHVNHLFPIHFMKRPATLLLFVTILTLCASFKLIARPEHFTVVDDGRAHAVIVISTEEEREAFSPKATSTVREVAQEFIALVEAMSGVKLDVITLSPRELESGEVEKLDLKGKMPVFLGKAALVVTQHRSTEIEEALRNPSGFYIKTSESRLAIAGSGARATEIGVHAFFEELGVRWFFPGELGTILPAVKSISLPIGERVESPTFEARHFQLATADQWLRHQRVGGPYFPGAHGLKLGKDVSIDTHPHLYALVHGVRSGPQYCLSNPETLSRAIEQTRLYFSENPDAIWRGMGPADASGYCECEGCKTLDGGDWDPFSNEPSVTDRYLWFFNSILEAIEGEFPQKKIAFYIYHNYLRPPVKIKPHRNIVGALAPIGLCRVHGLNNPLCPEKGYLKELVEKWRALLPELYERGYWFNLADPGMIFFQRHRLEDEIKWYAGQGIKGFRTEALGMWAAQGPSLWLAGKLMWNAQANVDALLDDYCEKLFGAAAPPMRAYFNYLDERLKLGDHHTGSAFDILRFYPQSVRDKARRFLDEARALAATSPYRERVELFREGFDYSDAFASMLAARDRHEWRAAHEALGRMDTIGARLSSKEPPLLSPQGEVYLRRFFRLPVEQGFKRVSGGNRVVAPLGDEWEFQLDPQKVGDALEYYRPELTGGNWLRSPTFSTTWSEQGLRYYKGFAWFRQEVTIPPEAVGKRLFLWFGGVDESARVWVNGKLVGTSPSSAFTPFEVDATEAIVAGRNSITLCVANLRVDELGTGGITAPGFIYLPEKGRDAHLDNLKPLRNTFP